MGFQGVAGAFEGSPGTMISVDQLRSRNPAEVVIVDTRPAWKFLISHIPGAVNLNNWQDFTNTEKSARGILIRDLSFIVGKLRPLGFERNKAIVVYGDPRDPWRTDGRYFWMFEFYGFSSVAILEGGWTRWTEAGGAIERGPANLPPPSRLAENELHLNLDRVADKNWILERLQSDNLAIVDNRTRSEFDGATPFGSPRGGHIPHAVHIDWRDFFDEQGILKNSDTLVRLLDTYKINRNKEVVVYCTGGVRSAMAYFVFRYLGYSVRNYDGSWWDWSYHPELPIESS